MEDTRKKRPALLKILLGGSLLAGVGLGLFLFRDKLGAEDIERFVSGLGPWGPLGYVGLYLLAPVFLLPGAPMTIAAGVLFGPLWGTLYAALGATGGATLAFLVARTLARDWVERNASGRLAQIKAGVEAEGWKFVALLRLIPLVPFNLLNYVLGLTRIGLGSYMLTTGIAMLPALCAYVYLGYAGREAAAGSEGAVRKALLALGLLSLVVAIPWIVRKVRGRDALSSEAEPR